jgi:hypothetical protein
VRLEGFLPNAFVWKNESGTYGKGTPVNGNPRVAVLFEEGVHFSPLIAIHIDEFYGVEQEGPVGIYTRPFLGPRTVEKISIFGASFVSRCPGGRQAIPGHLEASASSEA